MSDVKCWCGTTMETKPSGNQVCPNVACTLWKDPPPVAGPADAPPEQHDPTCEIHYSDDEGTPCTCGPLELSVPRPADAPRCKTCGHVEEAHTDDGCQMVLSMGRNMETDDEFCECLAFVPRLADAVRPLTREELDEFEFGDTGVSKNIGYHPALGHRRIVKSDDWKRLIQAARASVEAQEDAPIISDIRRVIREEIGNAGIADASLLVAVCAQRFCAELQEDADGVPSVELVELHDALDKWEATCEKTGTTRSGQRSPKGETKDGL